MGSMKDQSQAQETRNSPKMDSLRFQGAMALSMRHRMRKQISRVNSTLNW